MTSRRDRHGHGLRGPLAQSNRLTGKAAPVPLAPSRIDTFLDCMKKSLDRIDATSPDVARGVDICVEPVPTPTAMFQGMAEHDAIPLADTTNNVTNQLPRITLYERPIELRAMDRAELADLVHHTLVEQLASLTGRRASDIDPGFEDDW